MLGRDSFRVYAARHKCISAEASKFIVSGSINRLCVTCRWPYHQSCASPPSLPRRHHLVLKLDHVLLGNEPDSQELLQDLLAYRGANALDPDILPGTAAVPPLILPYPRQRMTTCRAHIRGLTRLDGHRILNNGFVSPPRDKACNEDENARWPPLKRWRCI